MDHVDITYPDGRTVRFTARGANIGGPILTGRHQGRVVADGYLREVSAAQRAHKGWSDRVTHAVAQLPIPAGHADDLRALARAAQAAHNATPERQAVLLRRRRESLVEALDVAVDTEAAERQAAHDDEDGDPGWYYRTREPELTARIEQARAAVEEFDREHPEIAAALEAERRQDVRRWAQM